MLRFELVYLPVLFFLLNVFAQESDRAGVHFGATVSPEFSYSLVTTAIEGSNASFTKTLGGLQTGAQLCISRKGNTIHAAQAAFSWTFPTGRFLGAISSGYSFVHYFSPSAPSLAFGWELNDHFRLNGQNANYLVPGIQGGVKSGYEVKKRFTIWLGYLFGIDYYRYTFEKTTIDRNDLSNTIRDLGMVSVHEFVYANRLQISLSYLIY
jgi:hypothetical protein